MVVEQRGRPGPVDAEKPFGMHLLAPCQQVPVPLGGEHPPRPHHAGAGLVPAEGVVVEQDLTALAHRRLESPEHIGRSRPELDLELVVPARPRARSRAWTPRWRGRWASHGPATGIPRMARHAATSARPSGALEAQGPAEPSAKRPTPGRPQVDLDEGVWGDGVHPAHEQQVEVGDEVPFGYLNRSHTSLTRDRRGRRPRGRWPAGPIVEQLGGPCPVCHARCPMAGA